MLFFFVILRHSFLPVFSSLLPVPSGAFFHATHLLWRWSCPLLEAWLSLNPCALAGPRVTSLLSSQDLGTPRQSANIPIGGRQPNTTMPYHEDIYNRIRDILQTHGPKEPACQLSGAYESRFFCLFFGFWWVFVLFGFVFVWRATTFLSLDCRAVST